MTVSRETLLFFGARCAVLAPLCLLAYWPFLQLPMISDDYIQVHLGRSYGPWEKWGALAQDALYRCRATSILVTHWTEMMLGASSAGLTASGLFFHFLNAVMVFLAGSWERIGWRMSFAAACFFAVYQRPQEAVIWYAALPELLVFLFVAGGLLCWLRYLREPGMGWYAAAAGCFVLALLSKESGVVFAPMAAGLALLERRAAVRWTAPFFVLAGVYYLAAHAAKAEHLHFNDGTFSLTAPFLLTAARSIGRMFWLWGGIAAGTLLYLRRRAEWPWLAGAVAWAFVALLPYSFLTYQGAVPSRHTYMASLGIALVAGKAFLLVKERRARLAWVLAGLCVAYQVTYLWLYKYPQYVERARPTELLVEAVKDHRGPVHVTCFPYTREVAQRTVEIATGGEAWLETAKAPGALAVDGCVLNNN